MLENLYKYLEQFMTSNYWEDENTPEQARAIFSTICLVGNIDADTKLADRMLYDLYLISDVKTIMTFERFENFMYEYLV